MFFDRIWLNSGKRDDWNCIPRSVVITWRCQILRSILATSLWRLHWLMYPWWVRLLANVRIDLLLSECIGIPGILVMAQLCQRVCERNGRRFCWSYQLGILHVCALYTSDIPNTRTPTLVGHTKRLAMSVIMARLLGWDSPCKYRNTRFLSGGGMYDLGEPNLTSQCSVLSLKGTGNS